MAVDEATKNRLLKQLGVSVSNEASILHDRVEQFELEEAQKASEFRRRLKEEMTAFGADFGFGVMLKWSNETPEDLMYKVLSQGMDEDRLPTIVRAVLRKYPTFYSSEEFSKRINKTLKKHEYDKPDLLGLAYSYAVLAYEGMILRVDQDAIEDLFASYNNELVFGVSEESLAEQVSPHDPILANLGLQKPLIRCAPDINVNQRPESFIAVSYHLQERICIRCLSAYRPSNNWLDFQNGEVCQCPEEDVN